MKIHKGASAKAVLGSAPIASTSLSAWKAATCHGNIWQMYGKYMEHIWKIYGTYRKIYGTCMENTWKIDPEAPWCWNI
jgi:hypothetical protein